MKNDTTLLFTLLLPILWDRIDFKEVLSYILLLYHTWEDAMKQPGFGIYIEREKLEFLDDNPTKEQVRRSLDMPVFFLEITLCITTIFVYRNEHHH